VPTANPQLSSITPGPDGALGFTEGLGNKIGRITTDGGITEFPIPTAGGGTYGITTGSDYALWFTELYANKNRTPLPQPVLSVNSLCLEEANH
jgi:virginiamycin B lyase